MLGGASKPNEEQGKIASNVLKAIHYGKIGKPTILLIAGLGSTRGIFRRLGISRFAENCNVEIGVLSRESERAVICDWIKLDAMAGGDPTPWIDAITAETQGWARHAYSYGKHALEYLKANGGVMSSDGLQKVLELGRNGRIQYYTQRSDEFDGDEIICLARALSGIRAGDPFTKKLLMSAFGREYATEEAEVLFNKFMEKGVIAKDGQLFCVPIPSMHDWIRSEFDRTQKKLRSTN